MSFAQQNTQTRKLHFTNHFSVNNRGSMSVFCVPQILQNNPLLFFSFCVKTALCCSSATLCVKFFPATCLPLIVDIVMLPNCVLSFAKVHGKRFFGRTGILCFCFCFFNIWGMRKRKHSDTIHLLPPSVCCCCFFLKMIRCTSASFACIGSMCKSVGDYLHVSTHFCVFAVL